MNIGASIRYLRTSKGLSQGNIEKKTGLLRCYLSRVENGHTVPSLETLQKIADALETTMADLVGSMQSGQLTSLASEAIGHEEIDFLKQVRRHSVHLSDSDRSLLLAMFRKFALSHDSV